MVVLYLLMLLVRQPIYFIKFLEDKDLNKELFDDLLQLFVVLFLKSVESVKVTVLQDLDKVFNLLL